MALLLFRHCLLSSCHLSATFSTKTCFALPECTLNLNMYRFKIYTIYLCHQFSELFENGRTSGDTNMCNIWNTGPKSYTISIEQNMLYQGRRGGYALDKFTSIKFKISNLWLLLMLVCVISEKPCQIARPNHYNRTKCAVSTRFNIGNIRKISTR